MSWACSEIRSRVLRSATVPFFYDKKNGTLALRSTLERISEHAHYYKCERSTFGLWAARMLLLALAALLDSQRRANSNTVQRRSLC